MKLLILCIFVIANASNNGKASLESFMPRNDNVLLADITKSSGKTCNRPCKLNVKPRQCYYDFQIKPSFEEDGTPALTVNDMIPGPDIHVCLNDIVIVKVKNKVPNQDLTIHWHGVEQSGTPYMDGVPMVTQCPISYGSTYVYAFKASSPGTFFYHSDSVIHQSDGVYGKVIVDQPPPLEPHVSLFDYDRSDEHTMVFGAKFPELLTAKLEGVTKIRPVSLLINGETTNTKLFVMPGYSYRLRLINAIAIECPLVVQAHKHLMTVIATDGKPVEPVTTTSVKLYPGERMDVVLRMDQKSSGYWVEVLGEGPCKGKIAHAMLLYLGFNYTSMMEEGPNTITESHRDSRDIISGQQLHSNKIVPQVENIKSYFLSIDRNYLKFKENEVDFRYLSDAVPKMPFFPAALLSEDGVVQINHKNFLYPNVPLLLKPRSVQKEIICNVGEEHMHKDPQCLQMLNVKPNELIELILINEGHGSNDSYTLNMHGYSSQVVTTWKNPEGTPISKDYVRKLHEGGLIDRNMRNPPIKDTVLVPNKGFTIIRLSSNLPGGSWLLECRSCSFSMPTAVLINVPLSIPKTVIDKLPSCGSYRPADVLLN